VVLQGWHTDPVAGTARYRRTIEPLLTEPKRWAYQSHLAYQTPGHWLQLGILGKRSSQSGRFYVWSSRCRSDAAVRPQRSVQPQPWLARAELRHTLSFDEPGPLVSALTGHPVEPKPNEAGCRPGLAHGGPDRRGPNPVFGG
jgi:hypothetical protein